MQKSFTRRKEFQLQRSFGLGNVLFQNPHCQKCWASLNQSVDDDDIYQHLKAVFVGFTGFVACPQGPAYGGVCPLVSAYGILVRSHVCLPATVRAGSTIAISVCDNVSFKCLKNIHPVNKCIFFSRFARTNITKEESLSNYMTSDV